MVQDSFKYHSFSYDLAVLLHLSFSIFYTNGNGRVKNCLNTHIRLYINKRVTFILISYCSDYTLRYATLHFIKYVLISTAKCLRLNVISSLQKAVINTYTVRLSCTKNINVVQKIYM